MRKLLKRMTALCLTVLFGIHIFAMPAYAEEELMPLQAESDPITVSVSILRDNITLAVYTVELQDTVVPLSALGGTRAVVTANANGEILSISVNGQTLIANEHLEIAASHNGSPLDNGELVAEDGDTVVFKCSTVQTSSVSASSQAASSSPMSVSSALRKQGTASKTVASKTKTSSAKAVSEISSEETSSQADSSAQSGAVSSESAANAVRVNPNKYAWDDTLSSALENASIWINLNSADVMQLVALSAAGRPAKTSDVERFLQNIKEQNGRYTDVRGLATAVIACAFCGISAENVRGVNLVQNLIDLSSQKETDAFAAALTLIALDSDFYAQEDTTVRGTTVQRILALQNRDGGFGTANKKSDVQTTAIVLTALSNYKNLAGQQIASGISYLSSQMKKDAYGNNCISVSRVIIALNTLGFSMDDERFMVEDKNLVQMLLEHQNADGGFFLREEDVSDVSATEYAVLALVSLKNGLSPYVINYQSQKVDTVQQPDSDSEHNLYLSVVLAGFFFAIVAMAAVGFAYFRKKHSTNDRSEITYEFKDEP